MPEDNIQQKDAIQLSLWTDDEDDDEDEDFEDDDEEDEDY